MLNPKNILTAHQHARRVSAGAQRAALLLAGTCSNAAGPQHAEHRGGQQAVRIPTAAGAQAQHARVACPDPAPGVPYLPWPLLVGLSQHRHFEETAAGTAVCMRAAAAHATETRETAVKRWFQTAENAVCVVHTRTALRVGAQQYAMTVI